MNPIFKNFSVYLLILLPCVCEADNLCKATEKVIFSCTVQNGKKILSVCGTPKLTKTEGYLQYRFGTKSKLELVYPSTTKGTQEQFYWLYLPGTDGSGSELSFNNHGYNYTISSTYAYQDNAGKRYGYIEITKDGRRQAEHILYCDGMPDEDSISDLYNIVER